MSKTQARSATPPPRLYLLLEGRALGEWATTEALMPWLADGRSGDGHPVITLPGFIASGMSTRPLRRFLKRKGYSPHCWRMGRNLGLSHELEEQLLERLREIHDRYGRKVSLIGWSLGGVYARWIANEAPELVRQVISLGSPFTDNPRANHSWRLYERLSPRKIGDLTETDFERIRRNPPVPTTAVYSRTDGITSWRCCVLEPSALAENIEVPGSHCGLGVNPLVLHLIADRLAQPEDHWRPFRRSGMRRFLYPRPLRHRPVDADASIDEAIPTDAVRREAREMPIDQATGEPA
ncbi:MAG: alpha/beta hydrolase [Acidobacteriota bacterium]